MKTTPRLLLVALFSTVVLGGFATTHAEDGAAVSDYPATGMVPEKRMLHIGIVVRDIEKAREKWVNYLGLEKVPDILTTGNSAANPTEYHGHPTEARAKLVFMNLENLQVELIEPIGDEPSHWREFLEQKGEGVHHIAFAVRGMGEGYLEKYAEAGYPVAQHGGWDTGEYGYMDTMAALGVTVELIENYNRK